MSKLENQDLPPLSLYIHIPWCSKKCPYCDFNSHDNFRKEDESIYVNQLLTDLKQDLHWVQGRQLESIFIGGGTPSLFSPQSIDFLLGAIENHIAFSEAIEITLEANPASSQQGYFKGLSETPVNRVSLGVQSFQDDKLHFLGRLHSATQAKNSLEQVARYFDNFNIDLMFGLKDQSLNDGLLDLKQAMEFSPTHLSWYQLTLEPNTVFYSRPPILPSEDLIFKLHQKGISLLEQQGYLNYEISAFSKAGKQSVHNLNYWCFGDYLAIGAGAHGKITHLDNNTFNIIRFNKTRQPKNYLDAGETGFIAKTRTVSNEDLPLEFLMNCLRLKQTSRFDLFEQRTGLQRSVLLPFLNRGQEKGLLEFSEQSFCTTELGERYLDSLLALA